MKHLPLFLIIFIVISGCRKHKEIDSIDAQLVIFSAKQGHIYNIFALDQQHAHSYNAVMGTQNVPWTFHVTNADLLGESGSLSIDASAQSSVIITRSTMDDFNFLNTQSSENKLVQLGNNVTFFIDFDNAQEAQDLLQLPRNEQRDTLRYLATEAQTENFAVSTH